MICVCVNEYAFGPLGVATTIPAAGTGTGSTYFLSQPALILSAAFEARASGAPVGNCPPARRGTASTAPAPNPYCKNRRREKRSTAPTFLEQQPSTLKAHSSLSTTRLQHQSPDTR